MRILLVLWILFLIAGCSAIDIRSYNDNAPKLDLFEYFSGNTKGYGIVQDRKGKLVRSFVVEVEGVVDSPDQLTLHERFNWSDGERTTRTWILSKNDDHNFSGKADDVVNDAKGVVYGNVLNWRYRLMLNVDDDTWKITFDDWMFLVSEQVLLNKATMSKFGLTVGEVTIAFHK
jgi:hypothetical protein